MHQTGTIQWQVESLQLQNGLGCLPQLRPEMLTLQLQHKQRELPRNKKNQVADSHSLPLLLAEQPSKNNENLQQNDIFLTRAERGRYEAEQKAKQLLIEQSQSQHKAGLPHPYMPRQPRVQQNNKIQGFSANEFPQEIQTKRRKQATKSSHQLAIKANEQKALDIQRSKRKSLLLHKQRAQTQNQAMAQKNLQKNGQSEQLIKKFIGKISFLKTINADFDNSDQLNKKILLLQQRIIKKRLHSQAISLKRKSSLQRNSFGQNQRSLALYTRKLIYSSKKPQHQTSQSIQIVQNFEKFRTQYKMLTTHSSIFQPLNLQKSKREDTTYLQSKSLNVQAKQINQKKSIQKVLKNLNQVKMKLKVNKGTINLEKLQNHNQTLHNVHQQLKNRQQAALKAHWKRQRTKIRNAYIKSQTVDIQKLSLIAEKNRKTIAVVQNALNEKESKNGNRRFKTEPQQSAWEVISPIFITQK